MEITELEEESIDIDELKRKLKDEIPKPLIDSMHRHNKMLDYINQHEENMTGNSKYQLSLLKFYYNKAEREAWKIAGYYKGQYQYYGGHALTERGKYYIRERQNGGSRTVDVNDSNYKSRVEEGKYLEISGIYEGYYVTWKGIAQSYKGMQATYRDLLNSIDEEGG